MKLASTAPGMGATASWGWMTRHGDVHHYRVDGTTLCGLDDADYFHREHERPRRCRRCTANKRTVDHHAP